MQRRLQREITREQQTRRGCGATDDQTKTTLTAGGDRYIRLGIKTSNKDGECTTECDGVMMITRNEWAIDRVGELYRLWSDHRAWDLHMEHPVH